MNFKFITGFIRQGRNYPFRDKWYKDEPSIHIDEKKKKELKKRGFLASIDGLYDLKSIAVVIIYHKEITGNFTP